jgi:predicted SprT family Zn-dependent metalloprotease
MDRSDAASLARRLMAEHLDNTWKFQFDRSKRRFGCCHYSTRTISLSAALVGLNDEPQVRDTILHEIAHALVGHAHGHDRVWRAKALEIGCNGRRCYDAAEVQAVEAAWKGECPSCGYTIDRHRLSEKARRMACGKCCRGRFDARYLFVWKRNRRAVAA